MTASDVAPDFYPAANCFGSGGGFTLTGARGGGPRSGLIEQLVPQTADEGLGKGVLHRLARRNVMPLDLAVIGRPQDGVRGQISAVVVLGLP